MQPDQGRFIKTLSVIYFANFREFSNAAGLWEMAITKIIKPKDKG